MKRGRPSGENTARRATLKDVAALAGVSPMTVSNVVNGRVSGYNLATRDKVLSAIRSTNYRPDVAARSLRTDRRMAVGMIVVQDSKLFLKAAEVLENRAATLKHGVPSTSAGKLDILV